MPQDREDSNREPFMERLNRELFVATLVLLLFIAFGVVVNEGSQLSSSHCCDGPCWDPDE